MKIAQFEAHYPVGTRERLAFGLMIFTGQRTDIIRMGRQHMKGEFLEVRQQKTGVVLRIPLHRDLQTILAAHRADNLTFLVTAAGQPFVPGLFSDWFIRSCHKAGLRGLSSHGLRKAMCRRLAEAGCSASQIAAISGHKTLREVQRYTEAADQEHMARAAMAAIEQKPSPIGKQPFPVGKRPRK